MLAYGGWATVSGVISPILTVFDRLVIGAIAGMGAVATYSVPFNIVIRLGLFPTSVQSALFPRYAMKSEDQIQTSAVKKHPLAGVDDDANCLVRNSDD